MDYMRTERWISGSAIARTTSKLRSLREPLILGAFILLLSTIRLLFYAFVTAPQGGYSAALCRFDCGWYTNLAEHGYPVRPDPDTDETTWAFFPLFPLLVRMAKSFSGWTYEAAAAAVNVVLLPVLVLLVCAWHRRTRSAPKPGDASWHELAVFCVCFPFSLYFTVPYTEALFAALMLGVLLMVGQERWILAGLLGAALTATRSTGTFVVVLVALAAAWPAVVQLCRGGADRSEGGARLLGVLCFAALGGLGVSLFGLYLHHRVGDALAFQHVQIAWDRRIGNPVEVLLQGFRESDLGGLLRGNPLAAWSDNYLALMTLLGLGACLLLLLARRWLEAAIAAMLLLIPLSTQLVSMPRYIFSNPLMILVAWDAVRRLPPHGRAAVIGCCAALQAIFLANWLRGALFLV